MTKKFICSILTVAIGFSFTGCEAEPESIMVLPMNYLPDESGYLVYEELPGATVHDELLINNPTSEDIVVDLYVSDAYDPSEEGFGVYDKGDENNQYVSQWLNFETTEVSIEAYGWEIVPFTITVPSDVMEQEYAAGVFSYVSAEKNIASGEDTASFIVDYEIGKRLFLTVTSDPKDLKKERQEINVKKNNKYLKISMGVTIVFALLIALVLVKERKTYKSK